MKSILCCWGGPSEPVKAQSLLMSVSVCPQALQSFYLRARREGSRTVAGLDPDLRVLETLIRIAEARARADLRQVVLPQVVGHKLRQGCYVPVTQQPQNWWSNCKCMGRCDLTCACAQEVTLADAEDAIELVQFSLFAGSPEEAAMRDFRPAGSRRTSKQARVLSHSSRGPSQQPCCDLGLQMHILSSSGCMDCLCTHSDVLLRWMLSIGWSI